MIEPAMEWITQAVGNPLTVPAGLILIAGLYLVAGVDVANITISIITFALLPVLQHSQNRDGLAIQAKLDALIRGVPNADNRLERIEEKTEDEIRILREGSHE